jgi:hypothetical protein
MRARSALLAAIAALAATAQAASATSETVSSGTVSATLSYDHVHDAPEWQNLQLAITRGATQVLAADPHTGDCEAPYCAAAGFGERPSIAVDDLDGDGEPEVILDLYTGGAHCCFLSRFYRFDGMTYVPADRNFGDPGYRIADLDGDGVKELITRDHRFGYAFTAFAFSLMPVRIYDLRAGSWQLVTERFPDQIRKDAKANWNHFLEARRYNEPRGAIAAWAADQFMLGHQDTARRTLHRLARQGRLPGFEPPRRQSAFVSKLLRFLARRGY